MYSKPKTMPELASMYTKMYHDRVSGKYFGKCPFCHGDIASFSADKQTGTFFCYACGAGGNRYDFLERIGAVRQTPPQRGKDPVLLRMYADAAFFYYQQLTTRGNIGNQYLKKRGITEEEMAEYGLGFAPDAFCCLYDSLKSRYEYSDLLRSGLFKISKKGNVYDLFRNRVMFPIMNENGDVIAFGGRVMDDTKPKYINSPDSQLFSKRTRLYGYPYKAERRSEAIIICEGYMDYIALHSAGYQDCAAVLGTALTEEHVRLIASHYKKVYLSMDSDGAGINAAKKSIGLLKAAGLPVRVLDFRPYKDPDEFLRSNPYGVDAFHKRVEQALPECQFLARHASDIGELAGILARQVP